MTAPPLASPRLLEGRLRWRHRRALFIQAGAGRPLSAADLCRTASAYFLVWRDVKVRYKQTLLGAAWASSSRC